MKPCKQDENAHTNCNVEQNLKKYIYYRYGMAAILKNREFKFGLDFIFWSIDLD